ncbi:MAG: sigma-70 family RNA polymerase sigma factor [Cyclobacteriaceae bacterium]|nr:sigma-70 family RNA polymerase sigma factor [Cyclobacteriaceae bacterium]
MNILGKTSSLTDQELIAHYKKKRDQKYFAELFTRYSHLIMGVCIKYLKNTEAAKDGVMNLYESISEKLITNEVSNFGGWIYVVTKNYCLGELRKQAKEGIVENSLTESMEFEIQPHHTNDYSLEQQIVALEKCIAELNKEQGKCVSLFYLKKKSYREVTNLTGFELNKVKSNIQNGKRNLKNCIEARIESA